jgi:GNAT superfamily N-acetyltransferase
MKLPWQKAAPVPEVLDDETIRQVLEHRFLEYAFRYQEQKGIGTLQGPGAVCPDLYIRVNGRLPIAYIHEWNLNLSSKTAIVGHFAVETDLVGKGFGEALARGFAKALCREFGVEKIVFSERKYSKAHEQLFKRLGAQPQERRKPPGGLDWVWTISDGDAV